MNVCHLLSLRPSLRLLVRPCIGVGVHVLAVVSEGVLWGNLPGGSGAMPVNWLRQTGEVDLWHLKNELEGAKSSPEVVVCDVWKRLEHPRG